MLEWAVRCTYCGRGIDPALPVGHDLKAECDHVISVADGGIDSETNYVPVCHRCNSSKGRRTIREWLRDQCSPAWAVRGWPCVNPSGSRQSRDW